MLRKTAWFIPASSKNKPIQGIVFVKGPWCTWWVMLKDREVQCVLQGGLILGENSPWFELYSANWCYVILFVITAMVAICQINAITVRNTQINEKWILTAPDKHSSEGTRTGFSHNLIATTDGAQSHGLNELNRHVRGMAHRLRESYLGVYVSRDRNDRGD